MAKLLPFPARSVRQSAELVLILSASSPATFSKPAPWTNRPVPPEALGNLLQRLAVQRPAAVLLLESIVAEMLEQLESQKGGRDAMTDD